LPDLIVEVPTVVVGLDETGWIGGISVEGVEMGADVPDGGKVLSSNQQDVMEYMDWGSWPASLQLPRGALDSWPKEDLRMSR
jgi:hypothetical protein